MLRYLPVRRVHARQVLDSRGNPTVEVEVTVGEGVIGINGYTGRAIVPSGASTGKFEAVELRDGEKDCYVGLSVQKAVENVNTKLAEAILGENALNQTFIDKKIIENENIKIFNINSEINEALDKIAKTAIKTALIAYIIIFAFMIILFNKKHAIAIIVIQIISILLNLSVHSIFNLSLNIFSVFALILSIGISIDYCIFFSKSKAKKEVTFLAIFLSMITTALSFGTLSFSGFIPVKSFGLFLFIGILVSFLLSPVLLKINDIID